MAGIAAIASPGEFRVKDTDPEAVAAAFDRYVRRLENFFIVTRSRNQAGVAVDFDSDTKKSLLLTIGGDEMIKLYDFVGKVVAADDYTKGCQEKNVTCSKFKRVITQKLYVLGGCPSHSLESS